MHFSWNIQFSSDFHQIWTEDPLCMYQHILSCIKQIMFAHTTISFHISSKSCLQVLPCCFTYQANYVLPYHFLYHTNLVSALPYPFLYQANHVCAYYHILSCIKQIMFASTTMLFHISSKLCTTISFLVSHKSCVSALPYPFLYQANHVCTYYHILSCIKLYHVCKYDHVVPRIKKIMNYHIISCIKQIMCERLGFIVI